MSDQIETSTVNGGSGTLNGTCGGTASFSGTYDNVSTVAGTITFNQYCAQDVVFVSGTINFSVNVTVVNNTLVSINSMAIDTYVNNLLSMYSRVSGNVYWLNQLNLSIVYIAGVSFDVSISGLFYHPTYGYVTISTPTMLHIIYGQPYPSSGVIYMADTNGNTIQITAVNSTQYQIDSNLSGVASTTVGTWSGLPLM